MTQIVSRSINIFSNDSRWLWLTLDNSGWFLMTLGEFLYHSTYFENTPDYSGWLWVTLDDSKVKSILGLDVIESNSSLYLKTNRKKNYSRKINNNNYNIPADLASLWKCAVLSVISSWGQPISTIFPLSITHTLHQKIIMNNIKNIQSFNFKEKTCLLAKFSFILRLIRFLVFLLICVFGLE